MNLSRILLLSIVFFVMGISGASAWVNTTGGDHEGADWTPDDSTTVGGSHYNIGTFTVTTGYTINIQADTEFEVYADTILVEGTINGDGLGKPYDSQGSGAGGNGVGFAWSCSGGGAGYGGAGGAGGDANAGAAGSAYGSSTSMSIEMGSSGGHGCYDNSKRHGGAGGGSCKLSSDLLTVNGTISCNGNNGVNALSNAGAGGGGSGGGIFLIGYNVTIAGTLSANGGNGGAASGSAKAGGGAGGGRIKVFNLTSYDSTGSTITVNAGTGAINGASGSSTSQSYSIPTVPTLNSPANNSLQTSKPIELNVSSTDGDGDPITYYFYGGTSSDSMALLGNNDSVGGNTFNWSVPSSTLYYWTARAYDGNEYSDNMTTVCFTSYIPPDLISPADSSTTYTTYPPLTSAVSFTWQDVLVTQYRLMIAEDVNFNIMTVDTHTGTNNSNQVLLVNKEYWWKVYAYNGTAYSGSSDVYSFNLTGNSTLSGTAIEGIVYADVDDTYTALAGSEVLIWNSTWSDTQIVGSNGYFVFTDVAAGQLYSLQAKRDLYLDSSVSLVNATTDPIQQDFYLLPDRTSEEWRFYVKFIIWGLAGYYEGVTVTVYENSDVTALYTKNTGTDGSATFIMDRDQEYRVTAIDAVQGINEEMTVYPKETAYLFFITSTSSWDEYSTPINEAIDIDVTTAVINSTAAYVNISYNDSLSQTTNVLLYLNQSNLSDPYNDSIIASQDGLSGNFTHSFIVSDYQGQSYYLKAIITHSTYGEVTKQYAVSFVDNVLFDGIPSKFFLYLSIFVMLFTAGMFGASAVEMGSMIMVTEGWVFYSLGWFSSIDNGGIIAVGLAFATVFSLLAIINKKTKKEGLE